MDDLYWEAGFWFATIGTIGVYLLYRLCAWAFEVSDDHKEKP